MRRRRAKSVRGHLRAFLDRPRVLERLRTPHLPQGAPTSPALANLAAFVLDARLSGLARAADATYTRYADDLAFSGDARVGRLVRTRALFERA